MRHKAEFIQIHVYEQTARKSADLQKYWKQAKLRNTPYNFQKPYFQLGVGIHDSRSPDSGNLVPGPELGLIVKSGTGIGTRFQILRDPGPGLKYDKSGPEPGHIMQDRDFKL